MEKANVTIIRMVAEERLHELVCLVVDEAHMVADPHRSGPASGPELRWPECEGGSGRE
ncbi:hypothetical protein [Phenylobacterium sp.]|uniref:hypothetical protein n=1 Tax=Phenylobacterium sp. TaxID=1871053 RepID=UPI004036D090